MFFFQRNNIIAQVEFFFCDFYQVFILNDICEGFIQFSNYTKSLFWKVNKSFLLKNINNLKKRNSLYTRLK